MLAERVPGATLDDHRAWIDQMRTMARTSEVGGVGILLLMLAARTGWFPVGGMRSLDYDELKIGRAHV